MSEIHIAELSEDEEKELIEYVTNMLSERKNKLSPIDEKHVNCIMSLLKSELGFLLEYMDPSTTAVEHVLAELIIMSFVGKQWSEIIHAKID